MKTYKTKFVRIKILCFLINVESTSAFKFKKFDN